MRMDWSPLSPGERPPGRREWVCIDNRFSGSGCRGRIPIEPSTPLGVKAIAQSLAAIDTFEGSEGQRKSQAAARRLAGGIEAYLGSRYLSETELAVLKEAAEILGRLGTAAELAKKTMKRAEEEEERRRRTRRAEAEAAIHGRYPLAEGVRASLPLVLAMDRAVGATWRTPVQEEITREMQKPSYRTERNAEARVMEMIRDRYKGLVDELKGTVTSRREPVAELLAPAFAKIDDALREGVERAAGFVETVSIYLVQKKIERANAPATSEKNP